MQWNLGDGLRTIVPDLAEKWEVSSDGLTYTFNLRDGVKFHDGTPFTSADVAATFNRAINPPSGVVIVNRELFSVIDKIETPNPLTAIFKLKEPRSYFLLLLADPASVIYPKKTLDENNGDLRKVIAPGTGAFVFKEHKTGEVIDPRAEPELLRQGAAVHRPAGVVQRRRLDRPRHGGADQPGRHLLERLV